MVGFEQFGKYILLERLASGGMAEVYLAKAIGAAGVNKFVAIKRILPQYSENQEFVDMFREEAKIAINLKHANIVSIHEFGFEKGQFFIVMDFMEGKNLRQIVNELKKNSVAIGIDKVVYIVKEVAAGLDQAHRCTDAATGKPLNIIHRDMSPQNIMVSYEGEVKIIDFGIAKAETQMEATKAGTLKGKFGYMSPEQAEGLPVDQATDIFSLGIVLWELLTNDRLFSGKSEAEILRKIRDCQITPVTRLAPHVPPELEKIVNRALEKDRNRRYKTAAEMHKDLNRFLNTQYPDFSPHDFSLFMKKNFGAAFMEIKQKMVDYAKVSMDEKTMILSSDGKTKTMSIEENPLEAQGIDAHGNHKVDLKSLAKENTTGSTLRSRALAGHQTKTTTTTTSITGTKTGINRSIPPRQSSNGFIWVFLRIATFSLVAAGLWLSWKRGLINPDNIPLGNIGDLFRNKTPLPTFQPKENAPTLPQANALDSQTSTNLGGTASSNDPIPSRGAEGSTETASSAKSEAVRYTISIQSDPILAEILIDGVKTGLTTPAQVQVDGHRPVRITLKKDKFVPWERELVITKDAQAIPRATLQKMPEPAYITIRVLNGTDSTVLYVNGRKLEEPPPVVDYSVPAGEVIVKAVNPFFNLEAQKAFTVRPNEKKTIDLIMSSAQKSPSP
ncbi:MAG: protein kinase [Bdellovibrionaceae bacterium]|nr:protein kinase [Pseudobdellovibrionaceae bacterium]